MVTGCGVAVVLVAGMTAVAGADEPRTPGAAGMFVPGGGRDLSLAVLTEKRLREALKLAPEQQARIDSLAATHEAARKAWEAARLDRKLLAAFKESQAESKKGVDAILTAAQARRLTQIERQVAGGGALLDDTNARELKLTDEQRAKIRDLHRKRTEEIREARDAAGTGPADEKVIRKIDETATAAIHAVLTDDQKKAWKELIGEPFDTTGFTFQSITEIRR